MGRSGEEANTGRPCLWRPDAERAARSLLARFASEMASISLRDRSYEDLHRWSIESPEQFWKSVWSFCGVVGEPGERVLIDGHLMPGARWFPDARLNFAENLLRRQDDGDAIVSWTENGFRRRLSWRELHDEVAAVAAGLRHAGVKPGDRVVAFLPNVPETVIAMLASASIGAIWASCSPDFGADEVVERFAQISPTVIFVCDSYLASGVRIDVSERVDAILAKLPTLKSAVLVSEAASARVFSHEKLQPYEQFLKRGEPLSFPKFPFDHPLVIVFSSGTTGKPKCIVHGAGGTLLQHLKEHQLHSDIQPNDRVFYFTTCGWMMWNWLVSALASEATIVLYEGSAFARDGAILFDLAAAERVTHFGISAKYVDAIAKLGLEPARTHDLAALRAVFSTGSPLLPESFDYLYERVKRDVCVASISGGTDIISCFVLGCPVLPVWRSEAQCIGLGMSVEVYDDDGQSIVGQKGELVCTRPFPSMPLRFWNDENGVRFRASYFERFPGKWTHGDYVELTVHRAPESRGMIIYGRSDTVLKPGGVRIGTAEIYRYVNQIDEVLESLVVGQDWRGDVRIVLFVKLREGCTLDSALIEKIRTHVRRSASSAHVPALVLQVNDIPRTRSNKTVELIVRDLIHGRPLKNRDALANPEALDQFVRHPQLFEDVQAASAVPRFIHEVQWQKRGNTEARLRDADLTPVGNAVADVQRLSDGLASQSDVLRLIERIAFGYVLRALHDLGWHPSVGDVFDGELLREQLRIASRHRRLFDRLLQVLAQEGFVERSGEQWQVIRSLEEPASTLSDSRPPEIERELTLIDRCGASLAAVLRGDCDPLSLLFPNGDATGMASLYRESPTFGTFNSLVPRAIRALIDTLPSHRAVRILELGAGTGGTTWHVVPSLDRDRTADYFVTDVGAYFLNHARSAFGAYPFMRFAVLDVERSIQAQAWEHGTFDVVVAANVLHATASLENTLANVRDLLAPGGVLILLEGTSPRLWLDITFGLTEGWWLFSDTQLRPGYPLMTPNDWQTALRGAGFDEVSATAPDQGAIMPQSVIVARKPLAADLQGVYAFVSNGNASAVRIVDGMRRLGYRCIHAIGSSSTVSARGDDVSFDVLDASSTRDALESAIAQAGSKFRGVVYLCDFEDSTAEASGDALNQCALRACQGALNVVRALLAQTAMSPRLWFVTRDALSVDGRLSRGIAASTIHGLGLAVAVEHSELSCVRIDLPAELDDADLRAFYDELEADGSEDRIVLRSGHRYVARLTAVDAERLSNECRVSPDRSYLITGGFGPLGLLFADWLISRGAKHVALLGRNVPAKGQITQFDALHREGVAVIAASVDVSDADALRMFLNDLQANHPPLAGVMHCAGTLDDAALIDQNVARFANVFRAKVTGAWNLHSLTREHPLDFFVLFSSTAALLGHAGQANHSAANAFLDSLASHRRAQGLAGLSINWGSWSKIGAASSERILEGLTRQGIRPIEPEQGAEAMERLLRAPIVQAAVADIDFSVAAQSRARAALLRDAHSNAAPTTAQADLANFRTQLDGAPEDARIPMLVEHVRQQIANLAGIADPSRIDEEAGFFELGMDSLTSVELRNRLQRSLGTTLPATLAFDYPNIKQFIDYLSRRIFGEPEKAQQTAVRAAAADASAESLDDAIERELLELTSLLDSSR
jgi:acetoacetyl-CoA synthetase